MESVPARQVSSTAERLRLLAERPVLRGLRPEVLQDLDAALETVHVAGGARIVERGQLSVPFLLIVHGGLRASFVDSEDRRHVVFEYFRGGTAGEALVLSGRPSPLDVDAIRDSQLLLLAPDKFRELSARHPELLLGFARTVSARVLDLFTSPEFLESFARRSDRLPRSIAVLSDGTKEARRMRDLLAAALSRSRMTSRLRNREAREALGSGLDPDGDAPYARLLDWLAGFETRSDLLVFECESSEASWLDFCLRQADRIMVVVHEEKFQVSGKDLALWREAKLGERPAQVELAIVHKPSATLPRIPAHPELPGVSRIYHVRGGNLEDAERLARWLLDRPVGLVLGGGGAHGIAHVGVLKALEEARVPVDIVGGTSMGAIFAGGHARGWSADTIMDHVRILFSSRLALYDPTIPLSSLLAGKKLDSVLGGLFEDIDIADLWTTFFCVSTNISRARRHVHESGSLREAIRSSCSIPGLFPPFGGVKHLLVDGGIVDNLPLDVMAERCRGPIIAVDVAPYQRSNVEAASLARGWLHGLLEGLVRKLQSLVRAKKAVGPRLFDILMQATLVGSQRTTEMSLSTHPPALYLVPDIAKVRLLDWGAYEALFRAGYACAKREIDAGRLPRALWEGRLEGDASSSS